MNTTTTIYFIFGGLALLACIGLIVLRLSRKRRLQPPVETATHHEYELPADEQQSPAYQVNERPTSVTSPIDPQAANQADWDNSAEIPGPVAVLANGPTRLAESLAAQPTVEPGITHDQSPQTNPEDDYPISWANQQLFGKMEVDFDVPLHIPKIMPDQVPITDGSDYLFGPATPAIAALLPNSDSERVAKELTQAGFYQPHAMQNLAAVRFAAVFLTVLLIGGILLLVPRRLEVFVIPALFIVPGFMWALPRVLIQNRAANRRSEMERSMPDMLDMLNMCVSQGLTIPASLKRISRDLKPVYPALASELQIVVHQAEVGNLRVALDNFAERVDVPEVDSFTTLMNQSERMGTSISDALTEYSNTMRESLRQRTDEKANKASFKLMFPTVLCMMPAVFMFLMGPAILELQDFFDRGGMQNIQQGINTASDLGNVTRAPQQVP